MSESYASPRRMPKTELERRDTRLDALKLRRAGMSPSEIADALTTAENKITGTQVKRWVDAALEELKELELGEAEKIRAMENDRLDRMLSGVWTQAQQGSINHINTVLKIMERRSKLLGLDKGVDTDSRQQNVIVAPDFTAASRKVKTHGQGIQQDTTTEPVGIDRRESLPPGTDPAA